MHKEHHYYIIDNIHQTKNTLAPGVRIFKFPKNLHFYVEFAQEVGEGPFNSLRGLRRRSTIFKRLVKTQNSKRINQILDEKNIALIKDYAITPHDKSYSRDFIVMFEHAIGGEIRKGKASGYHFFDKTKMRIIDILKNEDKFGVWKALIEVYDCKNNCWVKKVSNFFPKHWTMHECFHECVFAYENKVKDTNYDYVYLSNTLGGIPVKIIIRDNIVKSIYPIHQNK